MTPVTTQDRVAAALTGLAYDTLTPRDGMATYEIASAVLHEACRRLRDRASFETNTFVTAIDRFPKEPRFEVIHQFLSVAHNDRVRLVTRVRSDATPAVAVTGAPSGAPSRAPSRATVPTITDLFPGAAFSERECFDMFGIGFDGHAGLKRLLMPEDYDHFPLRKDFPHQGIEPDRLYRQWDERRRARGGEHPLTRHPEDEPRVPPQDRLAHS